MDINIKVIEGVRRCPALHGNNDNLDERNQAWMQLAEKLKMPEQFIKIRWHTLLQEYQRDDNFKYANNMDFVCRKAKKITKAEHWPEFIINEEDLKHVNPEEQEEFIFLEADEDNNSTCLKQKSKETECHLSKTSKQTEEISNKALKNGNEDDISFKQNAKQKEDVVEIDKNKSNEPDIITVTASNLEENMPEIHVKKSNESCTEVFKEMTIENPKPVIAERCEDVIFGELVSAMLKRMDENRKKNIKREIMNILFS